MHLSPIPVFFDEILQAVGRKKSSNSAYPLLKLGEHSDENVAVNLCMALGLVGILCVPVTRIWVDDQWIDSSDGIGGVQVAIEFQDQVIGLDGTRGWEQLLDICSETVYEGGFAVWGWEAVVYDDPRPFLYTEELVEVIRIIQAKHLKNLILDQVNIEGVGAKPVLRSKI